MEWLANSNLIWADYAIIGIIGVSVLMGLFRGFIKEALSLFIWMMAVWVGLNYSRPFSVYLASISYPSVRIAAAFAALFFATLLIGSLVSFLLSQLIVSTGLTGSDRFAGMVFGLVRGVLVVAILVMLAGMTPLPEDPWWQQSVLIPPFQSLAVWLKNLIPSGLAGYIHYR